MNEISSKFLQNQFVRSKMADRVKLICKHLSGSLGSCSNERCGCNTVLSRNPTKDIVRFSKDDIIAKREAGECWIVIHGKVYEVTEFLEEHPGGAEIITEIDMYDIEAMTREFDEAEHSEDAWDDMEPLFRGVYVAEGEEDASLDVLAEAEVIEQHNSEEEDGNISDGDSVVSEAFYLPELEGTVFGTRQEAELPLIDSEFLTHDVCVFRFGLPNEDDILGLPVGQHIILSFAMDDGTVISRPYTPVSAQGEVGFIDFLVKLYPNGKMSNHLRRLNIGDKIHMKGPKGHLMYYGAGQFVVKKHIRNLRKIGMIAGGSGITPMFQVIQQVANAEEEEIELTLLFANKTADDIILWQQLDEIATKRENIRISYTLDNPPENWAYHAGFITKEMIQNYMPPPADDTIILLCGPPPMVKKACLPALKELGYERKKHFFTF